MAKACWPGPLAAISWRRARTNALLRCCVGSIHNGVFIKQRTETMNGGHWRRERDSERLAFFFYYPAAHSGVIYRLEPIENAGKILSIFLCLPQAEFKVVC